MSIKSDLWMYDARNSANYPFVGVDGEGGNIADPDALFGTVHRYLLLRAGPDCTENPDGLSFEDCANFLVGLPRRKIYVAYFFDYDVTMMIRGLPQERAARLLDRSKRTQLQDNGGGSARGIEYNGFEFDYLPHKEFKIRKRLSREGEEKESWSHWVIVSDVGQFFQTSFIKTLEKWQIGTAEERSMIARGKAMRSEFHGIDDEIRAYNALEILYLEQLMEEFRAVCSEVGYIPKKWQGPGYLASAMLDRHRVPRRKDIPIMGNEEFRRIANAGYYGGRFETTAAGPITRPVFQYDINSAYPSVLRELPCLIHGSWRQVRNRPPDGPWIGQVYFNHDAPRYLYNLPVRDRLGNISFPKEGNGVYWSTELAAAEAAGTHVSFKSGWVYECHCDCRPFDFIDDFYQKRLALGKTNKGYVLKLSGNSVYGKIAQSIGYAPFANPVWAGLITAGCRAEIIRAYSLAPLDCYMIATDGIFMGERLELPVSNKLGEWEETEHRDGIFIVQPGIYFLPDGDVKTRGVERGRINTRRDDFVEAWNRFLDSNGEDHTVSVPVDNFITGRQALSRNKWNKAGSWESDYRDVSFAWEVKRKKSIVFEGQHGELRTMPRDGGAKLVSVPYPRVIGGGMLVNLAETEGNGGQAERDRMGEQPDWVEPLFEAPD